MTSYLLWHDLAASARRHPQRPAVAHRGTVLTYEEVDRRSTQLAWALAERGIGRGDRVGLLMPKSERAVVAMLGILKSGAAYVPVDPHAPPQRAAFVLQDCAVSGLVTVAEKLGDIRRYEIPSLETVILAEEGAVSDAVAEQGDVVRWAELERMPTDPRPVPGVVETDPAYLLYTSGSTGTPKGVILSHRHALTFVSWCVETFEITCEDRLSNHAPFHFDLSILDVFGALRAGACVSIVPSEVAPFPRALGRWIAAEGITIWYSVPSALTRVLLHGSLETLQVPRLRLVLYAGEVFPVKYLRRVSACWRHARFFNLYGPTETNVCTFFEVPARLGADVADIPIGKPCANTDVFVMDDEGRVVSGTEPGELYVRGPTVMLGYWGRPDRTSQNLVPNPLQAAFREPVYRTGDLVRRDAEGNLWFLGRRDHMVKSRGYRIELGEIEQTLYGHPGVRDAVVFARPDDEVGARLHAAIVPGDQSLTVQSLQAHCLSRLPRYMLPETFGFLKEIPRTSTGKADRIAIARWHEEAHPGGIGP